MYTKVHLLVSFAVGVVVGVAALWTWDRLQGVAVNEDPLDYVTIASRTDPIAGDADAMVRRLDRVSEAEWRLRQLYVGVPRGGKSLPAHAAALGERVNYPQEGRWRLAAVLTNVLDERSVAEHGRFVAVWFRGSNDAHEWLLEDPSVFPDEAVDEARRTWWSGELVVYYSPEGAAADRTGAVDEWAEQITVCATHANPCELPAG